MKYPCSGGLPSSHTAHLRAGHAQATSVHCIIQLMPNVSLSLGSHNFTARTVHVWLCTGCFSHLLRASCTAAHTLNCHSAMACSANAHAARLPPCGDCQHFMYHIEHNVRPSGSLRVLAEMHDGAHMHVVPDLRIRPRCMKSMTKCAAR
jgi:hypothetical protein